MAKKKLVNDVHFEVRQTKAEDIEGVVNLFSANGNPYGWSREKWEHYYHDYPAGLFPAKTGISLVAVSKDTQTVLGHFGAVPIMVSGYSAMSTTHVMIAPEEKGGRCLLALAKAITEEARIRGASFLCIFANARFALVAHRLLNWTFLGHLHFQNVAQIDTRKFHNHYRFEYPKAWWNWKLGADDPLHIATYEKDGEMYHQMIKSLDEKIYTAESFGVEHLNIWLPSSEPSPWSQPFLIHPLSNDLPDNLFDITNWYIEMGDSDTFEPFKPWDKCKL